MSCDPQDLATRSDHLDGLSNRNLLKSMVVLLCDIANMASCDPQDLMNRSVCLECFSNDRDLLKAMVVLLCDISSGTISVPTLGDCLLLESGVADALLLENEDGCLLLE